MSKSSFEKFYDLIDHGHKLRLFELSKKSYNKQKKI